MSVWTHVKGTVKSKTAIDIEKYFGKELVLDWDDAFPYESDDNFDAIIKKNERAWADYEAHPEAYMPTGSEGSLGWSVRGITYHIGGNLRDYSRPEAIIDWFEKAVLKLVVETKTEVTASVTATMGVGTYKWSYGMDEDVEEDDD